MSNISFLNLFSRSPIRALEEHMAKVHASVEKLSPLFMAALEKDWALVEKMQQDIANLEHEADRMKREMRLNLPKSVFMPVSRIDLLELLSVQDRLANKAKDIAGIILGRRIELPLEINESYKAFLLRSIDASNQANTAIRELSDLCETGFSGNEVRLVESMIATLSQIEEDTDHMQIKLMHQMYAIEDTLSPIKTMFIYRIITWTGDLADRAQDIGDRLQILLAR